MHRRARTQDPKPEALQHTREQWLSRLVLELEFWGHGLPIRPSPIRISTNLSL
jgi:hypothetical protein